MEHRASRHNKLMSTSFSETSALHKAVSLSPVEDSIPSLKSKSLCSIYGILPKRLRHATFKVLAGHIWLVQDPGAQLAVRVFEKRISAFCALFETIVSKSFIASTFSSPANLFAATVTMTVFSTTEVNAFAGWFTFTSCSILGVTFCTLAAVCSHVRPFAGANASGFSAVNSSSPVAVTRGRCGTHPEVSCEQLLIEVYTTWSSRGRKNQPMAPTTNKAASREL